MQAARECRVGRDPCGSPGVQGSTLAPERHAHACARRRAYVYGTFSNDMMLDHSDTTKKDNMLTVVTRQKGESLFQVCGTGAPACARMHQPRPSLIQAECALNVLLILVLPTQQQLPFPVVRLSRSCYPAVELPLPGVPGCCAAGWGAAVLCCAVLLCCWMGSGCAAWGGCGLGLGWGGCRQTLGWGPGACLAMTVATAAAPSTRCRP